MTITLTREEAQQVFDALEIVQSDVKTTSNAYEAQRQAIETLRTRLAQPEPEPVAWVENLTDAQPHAVTDLKYCSVAQHERGEHLKYIPLYKDPTPCQTCEALARTVMMDQTYHDNVTSQREITDDEFVAEAKKRGFFGFVPPKLWLWKNFVDGKPEYWAFDNPYPRNLNDGDPQTIGQPCGYAIFKPSRDGSNGRTEEQVLREISEAQERS